MEIKINLYILYQQNKCS